MWFEKHANALDRMLALGLNLTDAIKLVADEIRPKCLCCGNEIRHGRSTVLFCQQNAQCRKARRRLKYYIETKNLPREVALARVIESLQESTVAA